jgi:hypothetical protein
MNKIRILAVLLASAVATVPAIASTQPLPATFQGSTSDYLVFGGGESFPGGNLICFNTGCGGAFQGTVYGPGAAGAAGPSVLTTVWCVDYQLDVTYGSAYAANITTLNDINSGTESNVRYGTLDSNGTSSGWVNPVTAPAGVDADSSAYRYTLAAALTSQYQDSSNAADPTNPDGGSSVNRAIQEAIWFVTYNNEYASGAAWPPETDITAPDACTTAGENNVNNPNNYNCWVKYAEASAGSVNTSQWGVVSGPVVDGALQNPAIVNGYPSFQTFLVQVDSGGQVTHTDVTPEPTYFALTFGLGGLILFVRRLKATKSA